VRAQFPLQAIFSCLIHTPVFLADSWSGRQARTRGHDRSAAAIEAPLHGPAWSSRPNAEFDPCWVDGESGPRPWNELGKPQLGPGHRLSGPCRHKKAARKAADSRKVRMGQVPAEIAGPDKNRIQTH